MYDKQNSKIWCGNLFTTDHKPVIMKKYDLKGEGIALFGKDKLLMINQGDNITVFSIYAVKIMNVQ